MKKMVIWMIAISMTIMSGCGRKANDNTNVQNDTETNVMVVDGGDAATTPFGRYEKLVTYTLGNMTGNNNSNMPEGDTFEDNAYTRYLKEILNIQNSDLFEGVEDDDYWSKVSMAISAGNLPDIMVVNQDQLDELVNRDLVEDLSTTYEKCASDKIKDIYDSYGDAIWDNITYDGKLMALPGTNIDDGPNLLWLRKDWLDKLGLKSPKNIADVKKIIREFIDKDPGENGKGKTVGLICDTALTGECGYSGQYLTDILFASCNSYPKQWIEGSDGKVVYGSITKEAKNGLKLLNSWYEEGILDNDFLVRTTKNNIDLVINGQCGSFFGPWWTPNNPLTTAVTQNKDADWMPFIISNSVDGSVKSATRNPSNRYVVVKKGFEHPEIAAKMISVLFDYERYEAKGTEEIEEYYKLNVDPTARPISINVDYSDALDKCYESLSKVLAGKESKNALMLVERSYFEACNNYIESGRLDTEQSVSDWAAYTSRISACELTYNAKKTEIKSLYFGTTKTMSIEWWKLEQMEQKAYLEIVTGEKPIDYFDEFVKEWKKDGGDLITIEVEDILNKSK